MAFRKLSSRRLQRWFRSSEPAIILLAVLIGIAAGIVTGALNFAARKMHLLLYGIGDGHLSAITSLANPLVLLALPLGGLLLAIVVSWRRKSALIDVVEANALHGGRVPMFDSLRVCVQTLISNGFGASVGLEAAYAQAGGGLASIAGQALRLRRGDLRILVGAGAGASIGAAFSSPLAGAFYAFEVVIGAYTPAAIAPVTAASLAAVLVTRSLGIEPYVIATPVTGQITTLTYLLFAGFGIVAGAIGIAIMRCQSLLESAVQRLRLPAFWQPVLGGLLLMPIAWTSPQALSAGHGALHLDMALQPAVTVLVAIFLLKTVASLVSLSFGFRGGLFFASLFLGSLLGPIYAWGVNDLGLNLAGSAAFLDPHDAALVGMAALAASIIGAPMTLSLLVLEVTHSFALTGVVVTAVLCASAFTRSIFGYSFSTWRMHLRGVGIRSARDVGWSRSLTAGRLMRESPFIAEAAMSIADFRRAVPLGATSRVLLSEAGQYRGIVVTAEAYDSELDPDLRLGELARLQDTALAPDTDLIAILNAFEQMQTEDLAVVGPDGRILGVLSENHVRRRYIEEAEKAQTHIFGE